MAAAWDCLARLPAIILHFQRPLWKILHTPLRLSGARLPPKWLLCRSEGSRCESSLEKNSAGFDHRRALPQFLCAQPTDIRTVYKEVARKKEVSDALKYETAQAIQLKKGDLARRLKVLREEKQSLQKVLKKKQSDFKKLRQAYQMLEADQENDHELMTNLTAAVRVSARQLQELLVRSPFTALDSERPERMDEVLAVDHFPGLDDMRNMANLYFSEIEQIGKVIRMNLDYRNKSGRHQQGPVFLMGPFLAAVNGVEGIELLQYNDSSRSFSAVAARFPWRFGRMLDAYLDGESDSVPLDLSTGSALEQLTRRKTVRQRIEEGGFLVWPILLLAVIAS